MTRVRAARFVAVAMAAWFTSAVTAQTVYRCGPDGRSYSQQPCADGRGFDAADPRTDEQRQDGQTVASRERQLAYTLERDRLAREAAVPAAPAARIGPPAAKAAKTPVKPKASKKRLAATGPARGDFTVMDPTQPRKPPRRSRDRSR